MSSAVAGLKAHQTAMDVVGNNIANVNTYGYKASTTMFRDVMYQTISSGNGGTAAKGGTNPSQIGYGANASAVEVNTSRAGMVATSNPTDCYIDGEGYFVVNTGDGKLSYTRVGDNLKIDGSGNLTDGAGNILYGISGEAEAGTSAIADPKAITCNVTNTTYKNISIGQDGKVTAEKTDTNGTATTTIGTIALAYFSNPAGLTSIGNSCYSAGENSGKAVYYAPGSGSTGSLTTGALEASGTDLATEFTNMIQFERGFQANTKIVSVNDEMLQTLVNMKN